MGTYGEFRTLGWCLHGCFKLDVSISENDMELANGEGETGKDAARCSNSIDLAFKL